MGGDKLVQSPVSPGEELLELSSQERWAVLGVSETIGGPDPIFIWGESASWMEHREPDQMLVDLLGSHCTCLGQGLGWSWLEAESSERTQEVFKRKVDRTWRRVGWMWG